MCYEATWRDSAQKRRMSKRKTPRRVYASPAQGQVREPMCLGQSEGKSNRR